jgi:hypothetical protein
MDLGSLYSLLHNSTIDVDQESMRMMVGVRPCTGDADANCLPSLLRSWT